MDSQRHFLTKVGDLGAVLRISGTNHESLDHAGTDYVVKCLETASHSLDDKARLYQILFKHNCQGYPYAEYENLLLGSTPSSFTST